MNAPDLSIHRAIQLHESGCFEEAAAIYNALLQADPQHFDSLHLLGVLACQVGQYEQSAVLINAALEVNAGLAAAHNNLGNALKGMGQADSALAAYSKAISLDANFSDALFNRGVCHHEQGRLQEAMQDYKAAVLLDLNHVSGWLNIGIVYHALGKFEEALQAFNQALSLQPESPQILSNRGNACKAMGRVDEALSAYRHAIAINPDFIDAHFNLGVALQEIGQLEAALEAYVGAERVHPHHPETLLNKGVVLRGLGRLEEAIAAYDKAIEANSHQNRDSAPVWCNRGNTLKELKRLEEALDSFDHALSADPLSAVSHNDRGNVLRALQRPEEALIAYQRAIELKPAMAEAWVNRGVVLKELNRIEDALASQDRAIELQPNLAQAHGNRGVILEILGRAKDALAAYDLAIEIDPEYAEAHSNRGNILREMNRLNEALESHDRATSIRPNLAEANWNKALALLTLGRYAEGWPLYEWGWETKERGIRRQFNVPQWSGKEPIAGKKVLLHCEQGLGDTLQFCRYAPEVAALGAKVIFEVPKVLQPVLASLRGVHEWVTRGDPLPAFDFHCPLMSLPLAFGTEISSIPSKEGYLAPEETRIAKWKSRLNPNTFNIGVCWQGSKRGQRVGNSFPVEDLNPIGKVPGVTLYSLQKLDDSTEKVSSSIITFGEELDSDVPFLDTAALITQLDLVITTDTSIAHLAGALGAKTWVALRYVPDWRWMLGRDDCPWYAMLSLFRQNSERDWKHVFNSMAEELMQQEQLIFKESLNRSPLAPVSWGELIDKISILEIKSSNIKNVEALNNINRERIALIAEAKKILEDFRVIELYDALMEVNSQLWKVEDRLRQFESEKRFNDEFILNARSVYKLNDKRAELKRSINKLTNSSIVEEKSYWIK